MEPTDKEKREGVDEGLLTGPMDYGNGSVERNGDSSSLCKNGKRSIVSKRFLSRREKGTLATLCFINLLNYMDRFTLSGKCIKI
jgi:hypothetical protein